jgi:hypothetical protein
MALYGGSRDVSLFRKLNRELLHRIISQQIAFYKVDLERTTANLYGESNGTKNFSQPVLLNSLIKRNIPDIRETDIGNDYSRSNVFFFLFDDLTEAGIYPEQGDIIYYNGDYYEIEKPYRNQLFLGKDPDYNYASNPLNPELANFGWKLSLGCVAHYASAEKVGLEKGR